MHIKIPNIEDLKAITAKALTPTVDKHKSAFDQMDNAHRLRTEAKLKELKNCR